MYFFLCRRRPRIRRHSILQRGKGKTCVASYLRVALARQALSDTIFHFCREDFALVNLSRLLSAHVVRAGTYLKSGRFHCLLHAVPVVVPHYIFAATLVLISEPISMSWTLPSVALVERLAVTRRPSQYLIGHYVNHCTPPYSVVYRNFTASFAVFGECV